MVYLDNAATTFPKPESVYVAMDQCNRLSAVNAGRGAYKVAREASAIISDTKARILSLIGANDGNVVITPSITTALNQIILGYQWHDNDVIYVSPYEHNAVARTLFYLSKKCRIQLKQLPLTDSLEIDLKRTSFEFAKDNPAAIICTHVSNVTGYILPVKELFAEGKKYNSLNILDSAQSLGLVPINVHDLKVDILAFAGHKTLYGPIGVGGFVNLSSISLSPIIVGGTGSDSLNLNMPEDGQKQFEPASQNIVAITGLHKALEILDVNASYAYELELTNYLISSLAGLPNVIIYSPYPKEVRIGMLSFNVKGYTSDQVGLILDEEYDIAVRTGYHCAPYIHSLLNDIKYLGTVRASVSRFSSFNDIDCLVNAIKTL